MYTVRDKNSSFGGVVRYGARPARRGAGPVTPAPAAPPGPRRRPRLLPGRARRRHLGADPVRPGPRRRRPARRDPPVDPRPGHLLGPGRQRPRPGHAAAGSLPRARRPARQLGRGGRRRPGRLHGAGAGAGGLHGRHLQRARRGRPSHRALSSVEAVSGAACPQSSNIRSCSAFGSGFFGFGRNPGHSRILQYTRHAFPATQ